MIKSIKMRIFSFTIAVLLSFPLVAARAQGGVKPSEARAIAKEAYIYGFSLADNYRIQYAYFVDAKSPEYKADWNQLRNIARVFTPEDKAIQSPNSDTPYSFAGLDLRAEPIVLTVPPIEKGRYFSVQLIDLFTHNFAYLGSRTTGNDGGNYLIAGPNWKGEKPASITKVIQSETEFVMAGYRTQLFRPEDIENVKNIQAGYKVQPLSAFLGQPAPPAPQKVEFAKPLTPAEQRTSPDIFRVVDFVLRFCPTHPSETDVRARFAKLGIGGSKAFNVAELSPEMQQALKDGIADAWKEFEALKQRVDAGEVKSGDMFGSREFLQNNYLYRMMGTIVGIYGNSKEEAIYPLYFVDGAGEKLDGSKHAYTLRFAPGQMPPVNAFWSLTLYELPASLLYANPLNRYLINSPMVADLTRDADGGLTLYVQNASPGKDKESNWLPAPNGPFLCALRLYWPKGEALDGTWTAPKMQQVK